MKQKTLRKSGSPSRSTSGEKILRTIGFIGLGHMGLPMASNLLKAGFRIKGYDASEKARRLAEAAGIAVVGSAQEAASDTDIVITMLPDGKVLLSVLEEIAPQLKDCAVVDCSTIHVQDAKEAHSQLDTRFLEAPVSGGVAGAAAGTLTFITGGEIHNLEAVRPVLMAMGNRVVHCGGPGAGQAAKICNNMLLAISMVGTCEALAMGKKLGLEPQALFDVLSTSTGACWSVNTYFPLPGVGPASPADNDFQPGFPAKMMVKDMSLAQQTAENVGQNTPLGALTLELYKQYCDTGGKDLDFSSIIAHLETT